MVQRGDCDPVVRIAGFEPPNMWPPAGDPPDMRPSEWNCYDHRGLLGVPGALVGDVAKAPKHIQEAVHRCAWNVQRVRDEVGPLRVTSGWRPLAYNQALREDSLRRNGGKSGVAVYSKHITGQAADIVALTGGVSPRKVWLTILRLIKEGRMDDGGVGLYRGWVHYDCRCSYGQKPARWGLR